MPHDSQIFGPNWGFLVPVSSITQFSYSSEHSDISETFNCFDFEIIIWRIFDSCIEATKQCCYSDNPQFFICETISTLLSKLCVWRDWCIILNFSCKLLIDFFSLFLYKVFTIFIWLRCVSKLQFMFGNIIMLS